jgi:hypothetical protein
MAIDLLRRRDCPTDDANGSRERRPMMVISLGTIQDYSSVRTGYEPERIIAISLT